MKKSPLLLISLLLLSSCASQETEPTPIKVQENNGFRTINTQNDRVGNQTVVCHNCQAQFKLSQKIQKISMKGDAIVECPICHHNYLEKSKK